MANKSAGLTEMESTHPIGNETGTETLKSSLSSSVECLFCDNTFPATENGLSNPVLAHLLSTHKFVIAEVKHINNFPRYMSYWKKRLSEGPITEFCSLINTNTAKEDKGPQDQYFLLTDFLPEDRALREKLKQENIAGILNDQQSERADHSFHRQCLFCKQQFEGNRALLFLHMNKEHSFNMGNPDNIVHTNELLDILEECLKRFQCLTCEKGFKDWQTLKDHMRKKSHKRLNPKNKEYDRYYLINYLEAGKDWIELQKESDEEEEEDEAVESQWSDWKEDSPTTAVCLFCFKFRSDVDDILSHMATDHHFNMRNIKKTLGLDFYLQVKAVNYIRRQVNRSVCPVCLETCASQQPLEEHMKDKNHCGLPEKKSSWNHPEYFFPTLEDDALLCFLDDGDEDDRFEDADREDSKATPT